MQQKTGEPASSRERQTTGLRELAWLVDAIPCGVCVHDVEGRVVLLNSAGRALCGFEPDEVATELLRDREGLERRYALRTLDGAPVSFRDWPLSRAARGESFASLEVEVRDRRGGRSWVGRFDGAPVPAPAGGGQVFLTTMLDITRPRDAERALSESEARYRTLLRNAFDPIGVCRLPAPGERLGRFLEVNDEACRILGYSRQELLALTPADVTAFAGDAEREAEVIERLRARGEALLEDALRRQDGSEVPVEISIKTVDLGGRLHVMGVARDLSCRRETEQRLRDSEGRFRDLAESIGHMVWTASPDGRYEYANRRTIAFLGRDGADLADASTWLECLHPDDREIARASWQRAVRSGEEFWAELRVRRGADGMWIWHRAHAVPRRGPDGRLERWFGTCTNIHDRVVAEQQLIDMAAHLEQQVDKRTTKLRHQAEQLRRLALELTAAEQRERKRLAAMIHDHLQQLLVATRMRIGLGRMSADGSQALDAADSLLGEALQTARSLTAELRPPVLYEDGLVPALRWLVRRMQEQQELTVDLVADGAVEPADEQVRAFLFEATRELLFNTVKHAGLLEATVRLVRDGEDAVLSVEDRGRGFDPEAVEHSRGGLGLFSIRERLTALGGRVTVRTRAGEGTTVSLRVPLRYDGPRRRGLASARRAARHRPHGRLQEGVVVRVLVVDDHRIVREGIANLLGEDPRIEVVAQAADGLEALHLVEALHPHLVVMDVNLPALNGIEATRRIKERWPAVAVVGLSVHDDESTAESMRGAGAAGYLSKGGDPRKLVETVLALAGAAAT